MVKAVIFDVDGTLIDSVDLHAQAWQEIFLQYGVETDFQEVRDQIGKGGDKLMKVFLTEDQIEREGEEIEAERSKLFKRKYLPQVRPFPGLKGLFERLKDNGIKIALASSAKGDELEAYKKITGIGPFLAKDTSRDDVSNSKPDPDIFRSAQKKLGIDPKSIIAIGDTKYDAESAGKAGMATIGVLCGGSDAAELRAAGCIALYRDPEDLLRRYNTSPLATWESGSSGRADDKNKEKSMGSNNSIYFLTGLGIGAVLGAIYAPQSGAETREFIRKKSADAQDAASQATGQVKKTAEETKKAAIDAVERGKRTVTEPLDNLRSAVEAGKKAYREAREKEAVDPVV